MKVIFEKLFSNIMGTVVGLYFMVAFLVFTPYYNWKYAQTHGFVKWVFFGEVVATAKAIAWPYFVFFSPSSGSVSHVSKAIEYANKATAIINKGGPYEQISQTDIDAIIDYYKKALHEAEQADVASMNRRYAGFGDHFRDEFIQGLHIFIKSHETGDAMLSIASQAMLDRFGNWYSANIERIRGK
jgi:hypothetical protein